MPEGGLAKDLVGSCALAGALVLIAAGVRHLIPRLIDPLASVSTLEGFLDGLALYGITLWMTGFTADKIVASVRAHPLDVVVLLLSTLVPIVGMISVLWLVRAAALVIAAFTSAAIEAPRSEGWMASAIARTPSPQDRETAVVHEASHALVFAALHTLPERLEVNLFDQFTPTGALGNMHWSGTGDRLPDNDYMEWDMLVVLAGRAGEIAATGTSTSGSGKDHADWLRHAQRYLGTHTRGIYYNEPTTDYQERHNHDMCQALQREQYELLAAFFSLNRELHGELIEDLRNARSMGRQTLSQYLGQAVIPENFPRPTSFSKSRAASKPEPAHVS